MQKCLLYLFISFVSISLFSEEIETLSVASELMSWNPRMPRTNVQTSNATVPDQTHIKIKKKRSHRKYPRSNLQVGGNYTYVHIATSGQPSTSGNLYGMQALYEYRPLHRVYIGLPFAWKNGHTHGSNISRSLLEFDMQDRIGYTWGSRRKGILFTLFSGFGYRYYGEKVSTLGNSVKFKYDEFYFPVGFLLQGDLHPIVTMGLNFQWMPQIFPTVTIVPLSGARWILNHELVNFKVEIPLTLYFSSKHRFSAVIQPFFEYWRDGHTSAKTQLGTQLHIPGNRYLYGGIDVNLRYSF